MRKDVEVGARVYSAHLDRWGVVTAPAPVPGDVLPVAFVKFDGDDAATVVAPVGLFETDHYPAQIGTHDPDGSRTHLPPGEVCAACSDQDAGRWVPVSGCSTAWAVFERDGAYVWLT